MNEGTKTGAARADEVGAADIQSAGAVSGSPIPDVDAGVQGAASFAASESREILNLLGESDAGGSCCGGSCGI